MKPAARRLRALAATAALLAVMPAPATARAAAAECKAVRSAGAWTVAAAPSFVDVDAGGTATDAGRASRIAGFPAWRYAPGGATGRAFVSDGVTIQRTTDGGCTWQRVYSVSPLAAPSAASADPAALLVMASVQYTIAAIAAFPQPSDGKATGPETVIAILTNSDASLTGFAQNVAGAAPFVVARSLDGGTTWTTDLMRRAVPGTPITAPVVGKGLKVAGLVVSPADPRRAWLVASARSGDPALAVGETGRNSLFATSDAGTTWEFVAPGGPDWSPYKQPSIAPDPVDPSMAYRVVGRAVELVTTGATVQRRTLLTLPSKVIPNGIDVVRRLNRPAEIVVTSYIMDDKGSTDIVLHRTVDGGRRWTSMIAPVPWVAGPYGASPVGGAARITAAGDVVLFRLLDQTVTLTRWAARGWRAQARIEVVRWPVANGINVCLIEDLVPLDPAHRRFGFYGGEGKAYATDPVVGEFDAVVG